MHSLLVLLATPVAPERETVNLAFVHPDPTGRALHLRHPLDPLHALHVQQTVVIPQRQTQRHIHGITIFRDGMERRLANVRRIDTTIQPLPGVLSSPRACRIAYRPPQKKPIAPIFRVPGIWLTVPTNPSISVRGDDRRVLRLVDPPGLLPVSERRLDRLQEGDGQAVASVHVGEVAVDTRLWRSCR
jgi:hypothetical protein